MSQSPPNQTQIEEPEGRPRRASETSWFRLILPVALVAACAELATAVLNNSTLPVYFTKALHIRTDIYTMLMVPFFISEALFKSPLGVLADRYGRKPLMLGGALVTVFTPLLLIAIHYDPDSSSAVAVLVCFGFLRLLDGLGGAALWPALFAYVGDVIPEAKRGAAMGMLNVTYMIGLALGFLAGGLVDDTIGPVLAGEVTLGRQMNRVGGHLRAAGHHMAGAVRHHHQAANEALAGHAAAPPIVKAAPPLASLSEPVHYFPSFYLASALFAVAAVIIIIGVRENGRRKASSESGVPNEKMTWAEFVRSLRTVPQFLGLAFVTFLGIGCIAPLVKIFAVDEFHLTEVDFGRLLLWPTLFIGAIAFPVGHLADKWGKSYCVRLGFILCALGLWGIPILHHMHGVREAAFVISASVLGFGFVMAFPAWTALLTTLSGEHNRGTILGAVSTAQGTGMLIGWIVGGQLFQHVSHIAPFVAAPVLVTIGCLLALLFVREKPAAAAI